ncbi:type IV toxin-antitoxin system AbiEi family antitoxin domain-containing protein [Isoptericola sp. b490]|uniref:type IV toxin-antitoxin system AbiEi family antitoxin domain-containing protein n=1 Tax=Actinotalea lenta TaxID=3064654 RepID=UPI0027130255|nr:type IV toxin-antitoxin system AbiEi family antitoxin domain-containing protein [Isoptericola sp. b490]MDO8122085.1 type IV toxin-antitoxin system AbiEi family antitoxin domain-containing protein [Isoptericola sp. b490]
MPLDVDQLERLAAQQDGVVSRAQVLALGGSHGLLTRAVDSGRWRRLLPGVVVTHSGPVPWIARAQAAALYAGRGAALSHAAAGYLLGFVRKAPRTVDVSVPAARRVRNQPGLRVHRRRSVPVLPWSPPLVTAAATVLDLVELASTEDDVVSLVAAAVRARVPVASVASEIARRPRLRTRGLLVELLTDVGEGVESALELRFRRDVERRHGLPRATLQVRERVGGRWIRADALYAGMGVRVELDGSLGHPGGRTDADTWRDNAVAVERLELTLRYRWSHVVGGACATAAQVEAALRSRGWQGRAHPCSPRCSAGRKA